MFAKSLNYSENHKNPTPEIILLLCIGHESKMRLTLNYLHLNFFVEIVKVPFAHLKPELKHKSNAGQLTRVFTA